MHGRADRFLVLVANGQVAALNDGLLSIGFDTSVMQLAVGRFIHATIVHKIMYLCAQYNMCNMYIYIVCTFTCIMIYFHCAYVVIMCVI